MANALRFPQARWRPLPENSNARFIRPTQLIYHTAVDGPNTSTLFGFFNSRGINLESHFYVDKRGAAEQYMAADRRADANYRANGRALSIETWDGGNPIGNAWTDAQLETLIAITIWAHEEWNIPLSLCANDYAPGIGWHSMWSFRDKWNQAGVQSSNWTPSRGKTCPGKTRIAQIRDVILPALAEYESSGSTGKSTIPTPTEEEHPMNDREAAEAVVGAYAMVLRRYPDDAGKAHWLKVIDDQDLNYSDFLNAFTYSARNEIYEDSKNDRDWRKLVETKTGSSIGFVVEDVKEAVTKDVVADLIKRIQGED